jgi:fucose 4-O-acetylase-like acetyltransferase
LSLATQTVRTAQPHPSSAHQTDPGSAHRPPQQRDPYLDNAKFLAVVLVVVGHAWNNLSEVHGVEAGYLLLYLFHMPVFVLVTGYLSRRSTALTPGRAQAIVGTLVVPYLIFQAGYGVLASLAGIEASEPGLVSPSWLMWFLAAVACWRATAAVWQHMRAPVAVAVAISLAGGATSAGALALTQVLGLLPFFVLGLSLRPHHLRRLRTPRVRLLAVGTLAAAAVGCFVATPVSDLRMEWVYWRSSYTELGVSWVEGGVIRLAMLLAALVLSAAFLALVPERRTWFTRFGAHTLYAYLLHGLVVLLGMATGVFDLATEGGAVSDAVGVALVTAAAAAVAWALMTEPVRRVFRPVVQPDLRVLWRRDTDA